MCCIACACICQQLDCPAAVHLLVLHCQFVNTVWAALRQLIPAPLDDQLQQRCAANTVHGVPAEIFSRSSQAASFLTTNITKTFPATTLALQGKLEELEKELTVINENSDRLKKSEAELIELQLVLEQAGAFFDDARASASGRSGGSQPDSAADTPLLDDVPVRHGAALALLQ